MGHSGSKLESIGDASCNEYDFSGGCKCFRSALIKYTDLQDKKRILIKLGYFTARLGNDYLEAIKYYTDALAIENINTNNLGLLYLYTGDLEKARLMLDGGKFDGIVDAFVSNIYTNFNKYILYRQLDPLQVSLLFKIRGTLGSI